MRYLIEVTAEEREEVVLLLREVARKIKRGKDSEEVVEGEGRHLEAQYCTGAYRVFRDDDETRVIGCGPVTEDPLTRKQDGAGA